jgi:hypothetical protein
LCHLGDVIEMLDEGAEGVAVSRDDELLAALDDGHERLHTHIHTNTHKHKHTHTYTYIAMISGLGRLVHHTTNPDAGPVFWARQGCFDKKC